MYEIGQTLGMRKSPLRGFMACYQVGMDFRIKCLKCGRSVLCHVILSEE